MFNYSKLKLSESMEKVLNRGLNFAILPNKLDITEVYVNLKRLDRAAIWQEFFYGREKITQENQIFRTHKTNLPKNYIPPEGLKTFLNSVKSEISDPRNRNNFNCNLPENEMQALKELKRLQRERQIIIKPCDKGTGIIILPFDEYLRSCYEHLMSEQSPGNPYYSPVDNLALEKLKVDLTNVIEDALKKNIITAKEYTRMNPEGKGAGRFYCNHKVHKEHDHNRAPPVRPITSQSGSVCEGIATYVEHHVKHMATEHDTYIQDTQTS